MTAEQRDGLHLSRLLSFMGGGFSLTTGESFQNDSPPFGSPLTLREVWGLPETGRPSWFAASSSSSLEKTLLENIRHISPFPIIWSVPQFWRLEAISTAWSLCLLLEAVGLVVFETVPHYVFQAGMRLAM